MEWLVVVAVLIFAILGSIYCLWNVLAGWKEVREAPARHVQVGQGIVRRLRALPGVLAVAAELCLTVAFILGATLVAWKAVLSQDVGRRQQSELDSWYQNSLIARQMTGPNNSRLIIHFANSIQDHPVVFLDSTGQPIGDVELAQLSAQFPDVQDLLLGRTQITDAGLLGLRTCRNLDSLSLHGLPITNQGLENLQVHHTLTFLDLSGTNISDEGLDWLSNFPNLEELRLCRTRITDSGLLRLHGIRNLQFLKLTDTAVTQQGIDELRGALPNCSVEHKAPRGL